MQRRSAVKNLALTIGASIILPSWANAWNKDSFPNYSAQASSFQEKLLAEIVETIIPKNNTLGAKELNIQQFIPVMVMDCYDKNTQQIYKKGFDLVNNSAKNVYSKSFEDCDSKQRLEVLDKLSKSENLDEKNFIQLIKELTIQGYLNSEYVMTNLRKFEFAPAHFYGCVPIKK